MKPSPKTAEIRLKNNEDSSTLFIGGDWTIDNSVPNSKQFIENLTLKPLQFDVLKLGEWDSRLITFLVNLRRHATNNNIAVDYSNLPEGAQRLLNLAFAVEEREGARKTSKQENILVRVGSSFTKKLANAKSLLTFIGEITLSFGRFIRGKANYQKSDLWVTIQETGAEAFPIVSLIAFLVGAILAFVGVVQLVKFGAGIYVADLVAVGVVREMGAIMTGIIMAGRTGAAFAAQLGTMKVNEEIDALTTMGIDPIDYLVLPKLIGQL